MSDRAVFLDRDGVLNEVVMREGQVASPRLPEEFRLHDLSALKRLQGYRLFVVTNQPDVARGKLTAEALAWMHAQLPGFDEILACTHDNGQCSCRKPLPGMLLDLAERWQLDLGRSWMIGDSWKDMDCARAAGCRGILLERSYNRDARADFRVASLDAAVDLILQGS